MESIITPTLDHKCSTKEPLAYIYIYIYIYAYMYTYYYTHIVNWQQMLNLQTVHGLVPQALPPHSCFATALLPAAKVSAVHSCLTTSESRMAAPRYLPPSASPVCSLSQDTYRNICVNWPLAHWNASAGERWLIGNSLLTCWSNVHISHSQNFKVF